MILNHKILYGIDILLSFEHTRKNILLYTRNVLIKYSAICDIVNCQLSIVNYFSFLFLVTSSGI